MAQTALNLKNVLTTALGSNIPLWPEKYSAGFKIGLYLAAAHLLLFVSNTLYMIYSDEGRWHMCWIICGFVDFPASLLLTEIILPMLFRNPLEDPFMSNSLSTLIVFSMFYSLVGTVWYFWLPVLIEKAGRKISTTRWTFAAVDVLLLIPIFAHWLQLLRFAAGGSEVFVPRLYSIMPVLWTLLWMWLFFATKWKKSVLWLLVLTPFAYYYFARDLFYYITLIRR